MNTSTRFCEFISGNSLEKAVPAFFIDVLRAVQSEPIASCVPASVLVVAPASSESPHGQGPPLQLRDLGQERAKPWINRYIDWCFNGGLRLLLRILRIESELEGGPGAASPDANAARFHSICHLDIACPARSVSSEFDLPAARTVGSLGLS